MSDNVRQLYLNPNKPKLGLLQERLMKTLEEECFDELSVAEMVGVLEFLKWNIINRSD